MGRVGRRCVKRCFNGSVHFFGGILGRRPGRGASFSNPASRNADRREKEKAIHKRFAQRIEAGLGQLDKELKQGRRKRDRTVLERRIGRLLGRNSRAGGGFKIELA